MLGCQPRGWRHAPKAKKAFTWLGKGLFYDPAFMSGARTLSISRDASKIVWDRSA